MDIEKNSNSKSKETFPNFYPFAQNLHTALDSSTATYSTLDFFDAKVSEESKAHIKKINPLRHSDSFNLDTVNSAISDISYFSLDSIYLLALISANNIHFLDLPKKANSSFIFRETLSLEIIEKKDKLIENPLEGIFKPTTLEKEFLNCCDFGYRIRSNSSRITYSESDTDLILACAGRIGLIYIITIDEGFAVDYLYGHINEVYSVKFATPNQLFNFQNILLSGSKDGSMILWNIKNEVKVAIFAPKQNPHSDVLNAVWSPGCDYIASVGLESTVKVWMVNEKLKKKIEESHLLNLKNVKSFKSIEMNAEIYRNNEAHKNFEWQIDQIEFYGYSFLSKDAFGNVVFWIPNFENQGCIVFKNFCSQQLYPNFFIKFGFSTELGILALGNDQGEIFIYDFLNITKSGKGDNLLLRKYELEKDRTLVRKVIILAEKNILLAISSKNQLYKFDLTTDAELMEKIKARDVPNQKK